MLVMVGVVEVRRVKGAGGETELLEELEVVIVVDE